MFRKLQCFSGKVNNVSARIMTTKFIFYTSGNKTVKSSTKLLETIEKDGIKHTWEGTVIKNQANFTWNFDWEGLQKQGFVRLAGHLIVRYYSYNWNPIRVDIDWTSAKSEVTASIGSGYPEYAVHFEYNLTAHYSESSPLSMISYDEMFAASDKTDVVLLVEGKKLNVNKAFLSFHSEFFSSLFSSNFKEGQMKEIEIKEVSYADFALLLSSFYPNPQFPNDGTVVKLIEMADRYQVTSVIGIVEYHLLNNSRIQYEQMLWMADKYMMPHLLKKCIGQMNSLQKAKELKASSQFAKLSDKTRLLIFERLMAVV
ncbi:hypothetical protein B9Z55_007745 [Caenorhabditis nigoni]|uniref:BTB domain-containing protein n=2 Tax=Caenorhabditis nigoni TaxID=1611254 RepID=A0A2G5VBQ3_9PELO|nr:hypothetical protein B9Z55_007745 [Caenorhabditis nigoni]